MTDEEFVEHIAKNCLCGIQDCLEDPYDKDGTGNYYSSVPHDIRRIIRATMEELKGRDDNGDPRGFKSGDRVLVIPNKEEATVIKQLIRYDYPKWFWGNVRVLYDDGLEGVSHSWQLRKL